MSATVRTRVALTMVAVVSVAAALAGCTGAPDTGSTSVPSTQGAAPATGSTDSPVPTTEPAQQARFYPNGTARQNLAYFNEVSRALLRAKPDASGRTIIDTLVAAGFEKKRMQVTPDRTAVDLAADNEQFSVKIKTSCIVGQAGNTGFRSFIAPALATGDCLVGKTRAIDW